MPTTKFIDGANGPILIETSRANVTATAAGPLVARSLQRISEEIGKAMAQLDGETRPSAVVVSFGLAVGDGGHVVITADASQGSFAVELRFDGGGQPELPGLPEGR